MARQIQGSQRDFSFGEIDVEFKRSDDHPARKAGLRQMANARILNSGGVRNRPGRRALYEVPYFGSRTERFIVLGTVFDISFAPALLRIIDANGAVVASFAAQGNGAAIPWVSNNLDKIVYVLLGNSIYVTFAGMRPQVITYTGAWTIADFNEMFVSSQKRTPFYRISKQGITLLPSAQTGNITIVASEALFTPGWVNTTIRFVNRQIDITGYIDAGHVNASVREALPGSQIINFNPRDPALTYNVGDEVIGSVSGSKGVITSIAGFNIFVQLLSTQTSQVGASSGLPSSGAGTTTTLAFVVADYVAGPGGTLGATSVSDIGAPRAVALWDEGVFSALRGYPASVFTDQFRLGFCDFPSVPGAICWSAINSPNDLYVGAAPQDAMFEIAPDRVRVMYVVPGPESSEFVFCDRKLYYIKIDASNPLKPGSVGFQTLSSDGCAQVQPRASQEAILYVNAGQNSVMAVIASGAYYRPFNTKNLTEFHSHLFSTIRAIAMPTADNDRFSERYTYVLNADGSLVVGSYRPESLLTNAPAIGWGPWSGNGVNSWVSAWGPDVLFTATYFTTVSICEVLDDTQYLDFAISVNFAPAAFAPPAGKGSLYFIRTSPVWAMDQSTRSMGPYQVDADGFLVPQFNGGEDLTAATLVVGQPWTMTVEPFAPDAQSGVDLHQRMLRRRISNFAVYVVNSTGFVLQKLFSRKETPTSPPLGTPMSMKRVPTWNLGENATLPPKQRETVESWRPSGHSFDPRVAIVKDTPGPLQIVEIGVEVSL